MKVLIAIAVLVAVCNGLTDDQRQCLTLPSKTLQQLSGGCRTTTDSRNLQCVAAINNYCDAVHFAFFGDTNPIMGVSRAAGENSIEISCVRATRHPEWGQMHKLSTFNSGCQNIDDIQSSKCLDAIHQFCNDKQSDQGGMSLGKNGESKPLIGCFKSEETSYVSISDLKIKNAACEISDSASTACFNAACKWCEAKGHSGGITQGDIASLVVVSCYKDLFSNTVTVQSTESNLDYYYERYMNAKRKWESVKNQEESSFKKKIDWKKILEDID